MVPGTYSPCQILVRDRMPYAGTGQDAAESVNASGTPWPDLCSTWDLSFRGSRAKGAAAYGPESAAKPVRLN